MTTRSGASATRNLDEGRVRVALDTSFLGLPPSGIGSYVEGLTGGLGRRGDVSVTALNPPGLLELLGRRGGRIAWDIAGVGVARWRDARDADVLHVPALSAPVASGLPLVVTVHDVIPFVLPEYRATWAMRLYLAAMRHTVQRARLVLTPSMFSKTELCRVLGIDPGRVRVTPLAVDTSLHPARDPIAARELITRRFGVTGDYLLHLAGFDRRKNLPLLVEAFARAIPDLPADTTLVLAGAPHTGNQAVFPPIGPVIESLGIADRVVLTGTVTHDERRMLYQAALGYVTPSMYEGFGLTPLEAMTCGVPVIAADRTSLPEVVGDAGLLVEPEVDALAAAIVRIVTDAPLRGELARRGRVRSAQFSWDRTAALTVDAYREALKP